MNGTPQEKDVYDNINQLRSDYRVITSKIDGLTTAVDALTRSRQFSWPAMLSTGAALVVFGGVVWSAVQMSIQLAVQPNAQKLSEVNTVIEEIRADSRDNRSRIGTLESTLEGFIRETKAKEIEIETQFKYNGIIQNIYRAEEAKALCRMDPKECSPIFYAPEQGRMVSNGSKH